MRTPEAGWYPDPRGVDGVYRWWTGAGWTPELSSDPSLAAPEPDAAPDEVGPAGGADVVRPVEPAYGPAPQRSARRSGPGVRAIVGVGLLVVLLVAAGVTLGVRNGSSSSGPLLMPPSTSASPVVRIDYDETTREATVGDVVATFPSTPWEVGRSAEPGVAVGLLTGYVAATTTVHPEYDGEHDWGATILLGPVDPSLVQADDVEATAAGIQDQILQLFYTSVTPMPRGQKSSADTVSGRRIGTRELDIGVRAPELPSRYDRVAILVVAPPADEPDGATIAYISLRPNDTSAAARKGLDALLASLRIA